MKRILSISLLLTIFLVACNSSDEKKPEEKVMDNNSLIEHLTYESFKEKVWDFEKNPDEFIFLGKEPAMIDFYADWCKPCKIIAPYMDEIAETYEGKLKVYKIDTQVEKELTKVFGIRGIPAVMFIPMEGQPAQQMGALPKEEYIKRVEELIKN
jgi:thioredoxin